MRIEISPNLARMIKEQVSAGSFASATAAVNAAVDFMFFEHFKNPRALRALIDEGLADLDAGRFSELSAEDIIAQCRREYAEKHGN